MGSFTYDLSTNTYVQVQPTIKYVSQIPQVELPITQGNKQKMRKPNHGG